jgi:hypothetical protein
MYNNNGFNFCASLVEVSFLVEHDATSHPRRIETVHYHAAQVQQTFSSLKFSVSVGITGEERGVHGVLVGKPEGKMPLGRPRHRWEDNIKMDLQEVGGDGRDWVELAEDRDRWRSLVSTERTFGFHKNVGNFLTSCKDWSASQEGLCCTE